MSASPDFSYNKSVPALSLLKLVCNQKSIFHWKSGGNNTGVNVRKTGCQSRLCHWLASSKSFHLPCLRFISHTWVNSDSPSLSCEDKNLGVIIRHLINYGSLVAYFPLKRCLSSWWSSLLGVMLDVALLFLFKRDILTEENLQSKESTKTWGEKGSPQVPPPNGNLPSILANFI